MALDLKKDYILLVQSRGPQIFIQNETAYYRDGRIAEGFSGAAMLGGKPVNISSAAPAGDDVPPVGGDIAPPVDAPSTPVKKGKK